MLPFQTKWIHFYIWRHLGRPIYVGQAVKPSTRKRGHLKADSSIGQFLREHRSECTFEDLGIKVWDISQGHWANGIENAFMDAYGTMIPNGFNILRAGSKGWLSPGSLFKGIPKSELHRSRMRHPKSEDGRASIKEAANRPETKAKKLAVHLGSKRGIETREKISAKAKGRIGSLNSFFGKTHSEETRKLLSVQKLGDKHHFFGKKRPNHADKMRQSWIRRRERAVNLNA